MRARVLRVNADPRRRDFFFFFGPPPRVRLQTLCSAYGWSLWGFIQSADSALDFDFCPGGWSASNERPPNFEDPASTVCSPRSPVADLPNAGLRWSSSAGA